MKLTKTKRGIFLYYTMSFGNEWSIIHYRDETGFYIRNELESIRKPYACAAINEHYEALLSGGSMILAHNVLIANNSLSRQTAFFYKGSGIIKFLYSFRLHHFMMSRRTILQLRTYGIEDEMLSDTNFDRVRISNVNANISLRPNQMRNYITRDRRDRNNGPHGSFLSHGLSLWRRPKNNYDDEDCSYSQRRGYMPGATNYKPYLSLDLLWSDFIESKGLETKTMYYIKLDDYLLHYINRKFGDKVPSLSYDNEVNMLRAYSAKDSVPLRFVPWLSAIKGVIKILTDNEYVRESKIVDSPHEDEYAKASLLTFYKLSGTGSESLFILTLLKNHAYSNEEDYEKLEKNDLFEQDVMTSTIDGKKTYIGVTASFVIEQYYYESGGSKDFEHISKKIKRLLGNISYRRAKQKEQTAMVGTLTTSYNQLTTYMHPYKATPVSIDENYNDDLKEFDEELRKFLSSENKSGLAILHGPPGTGKTSYIRNLISTMPEKRFVIVSANVFGLLSKPEASDYLTTEKNSIFILEDAEEVVSSREDKFNSHATLVSDLLNMSDGIIGDLYSLKFIVTFNKAIDKIDSALQREGRLQHTYYFDNLGAAKATTLSKKLYGDDGNEYKTAQPLSSIYNQKSDVSKGIDLTGKKGSLAQQIL